MCACVCLKLYCFQLQLLQQHARRSDIAAAIESAIGTLQHSIREQQFNQWSLAASPAEAHASADMVCAVCLERLCSPSLSDGTLANATAPSLSRPLCALVCPGQVIQASRL
jgi:hypothetical protein